MTAADGLERRYRRLLAWYPVEHRRMYGEEMVGVLLAGASTGRHRPGFTEAIDLLRGAALVRIRSAVSGQAERGSWADALALASLLTAPLMIVLLAGQDLGWMAALLWHGAPAQGSPLWPLVTLAVPLALALTRLRRLALVASVALPAWVIVQATAGLRLQEPQFASYLVLFGVQAVALAASPGPRYAIRLVSRRSLLLALPWLAAAAYAGGIVPGHFPVPLVVAEIGLGLVALAGLPALASARGRRVIMLLVVIPGSAFLVSLLSFAQVDYYSMSFAESQFALYGPPVVLAAVLALAVRRKLAMGPPRREPRRSQRSGHEPRDGP
jgi:hypothetical protein